MTDRPAPLAFVDTETTGLDPNRHEIWEVALTRRLPDGEQTDHHWFLPVDLGRADSVSLSIGGYYERCKAEPSKPGSLYRLEAQPEHVEFAHEFALLTHGAHLVAAVPSFDDAFLKRLLTRSGACPGWHYHLVDVEALAMGYLAGRYRDPNWRAPTDDASFCAPPWNSSDLTAALGIHVDEATKHTARGDVAWAMAIYDAVMGPGECPAGGDHTFRVHDESPAGPRRVVHCTECPATPPLDLEESA